MSIDNYLLVQSIGRATYEPYYAHVWHEGGMEWYMERCFGTETLQREMNDHSIEYWLAWEEAQIAGILKYQPERALPYNPNQRAFYLEKLYLMPSHFRQGAGQIMLQHTLDYAQSMGHNFVYLYVMKIGPVAAYERAGFHIMGETDFGFTQLLPTARFGWLMVKQLGADSA